MRNFTGEKLDEPTVRLLLAAAVRAPTAIHAEPWRFATIQDAALLKGLSDQAKVLFVAEVRRLHLDSGVRGLEAFNRQDFNVFYDAGTLIVICANLASQFAQTDCWLAAENLMLVADTMGLGTCVIGSAVGTLKAPDMKADIGRRGRSDRQGSQSHDCLAGAAL